MSDALQLVQEYFDAWNRQDAAGIVAKFAEGGTYNDPLAQELSGEAIAAYARGLWEAFPDLSLEIVGPTLVGDGQVAARWLMKGANTGPFQGLPRPGSTSSRSQGIRSSHRDISMSGKYRAS